MPAHRLTSGTALAVLTLAALALGSPARAGDCNFSGGWVSFGVVNPSNAGNIDTTGELVLDCTGTTHAEISLSVGAGHGASYSGGRQMTRLPATGVLRYNLYDGPARNQVLGDGIGGSVTLQVQARHDTVVPIYARMPGQQRGVLPGIYADVLVATVSY